jgi:hypothetical protein
MQELSMRLTTHYIRSFYVFTFLCIYVFQKPQKNSNKADYITHAIRLHLKYYTNLIKINFDSQTHTNITSSFHFKLEKRIFEIA